jgi:hypothetical protein
MATTKPFRRQFKSETLAAYVDKMRKASNFSQISKVKELVNSARYDDQISAWNYLRAASYYTEQLVDLAGRVSRLNIAEAVRQAAEKYFDSQPAKTMSGVKMQ